MTAQVSYFIPDPTLRTLSNAQLHEVIRKHLATANGEHVCTEESPWPGPNSEVESDFAQDRIAQARDILVSRGYDFTKEERQTLRFLKWPLSPEERELQRREAAQEEINRRRTVRYGEMLSGYVRAVAAGLIPGEPPKDLIICFGESGRSSGCRGILSWTEVQALTHELQAASDRRVTVIQSKGRIGEEHVDEIAPIWRIECEITTRVAFWTILADYSERHKLPLNFTVQDNSSDSPTAAFSEYHCFGLLYNLFPREKRDYESAWERSNSTTS